MIESVMYMPMFDTNHMNQAIIRPLSSYEKVHNQATLSEVQDSIKLAQMMIDGFSDIMDDLNFDESKLRTLQFNLDDNYDAIEVVLHTTSDITTKKMIENLLTTMAQLDVEIGDLILEHTHAKEIKIKNQLGLLAIKAIEF